MKKKIIALMLTSLILVGCGKKDEQKKETEQTTQKAEEKKDENKQEETKEQKLDINDPKSEEPDKDFVKNETGDVETKRVFRKNINEVLEHNGFKFTFKKVAILRYKPLTDRVIEEFKNVENISLIKNM